MRILHVFKVYKPDITAGIPEVISNIAAGMPAGTETAVLACRQSGIGSRIVVDGLPVERTSTFGQVSSLPISPAFLWRFGVRSRGVDLIASHAPFPLVDIGVNLGFCAKRALVIHWHADIIGRAFLRPVFGPLLHGSIRRADRIIVTNTAMIDSSPYLQRAREKCRAVPYGIDTEYWSVLTTEDKAAADQLRSRHPRLVVACGRLVGYKGFDVLLRAMRSIDGHLMIVGTGPLELWLKDLSRELGLDERVTFTGYVERARQRQILNAGRVFVLSSTNNAEGFGLVQVEAMCAGLPIVNTNLPTTVPCVARNGMEGLTVEPADEAALAAAINRLLDDADLAVRMGQAGKVRARENYGWKTFASHVMDVYREAIAERQANAGGKRSWRSGFGGDKPS